MLQGCGGGGGGSGDTTTTTTTTATLPPVGPSGLYWCEDLPTYYRVSYGNGSLKSATGQCLPSTSPGAYYTKVGEKDPNDGKSDRPWECFNPSFNKDLWTNAKAKEAGYEGACLLKDYGSKTTPGDVDACNKHLDHHPAICAPGPGTYWGACWSSHSENWRCVPKGDATIPGLAKGDCKAAVLLEPGSSVPTQYFYDGVCQFAPDTSPLYKCDTVTGYNAEDAATCGQSVDITTDKACFSLQSETQWECLDVKTDFPIPCDWTVQPGSTDFYKGACVFPRNKQYKDAKDAHNVSVAVKHEHEVIV